MMPFTLLKKTNLCAPTAAATKAAVRSDPLRPKVVKLPPPSLAKNPVTTGTPGMPAKDSRRLAATPGNGRAFP